MPGRRFREEIDEWSKGATVNSYPDKVTKNSSPRALNTAWLRTGYPAKRKGCPILTPAGPVNLPSSAPHKPALLALGTFEGIEWGIFDDGRWMKIVAGAWVDLDPTNPIPFTAGTNIPSVAIANNLLFVVNGVDAKKINGTVVQNFGIQTMAAPTVVDSGVAGNPSGTYRFAVTAANTATGAESSRSPFTELAVVGKKITVSWTFPSDLQIDVVRVHIFKEGLTDTFFRLVGTNVTPAASSVTGGYSETTVSITVNVTDDNINDLIILSPGEHDNDIPPTGATFIAYHNSRMFATDGVDLFFSTISKPESFSADRVEHVNPGDDQQIVAFASLDDDVLVIGKTHSIHRLLGPNDPNVWEIREVAESIGIKAARTLIAVNSLLMWVAEQGMFQMEAGGVPTRIIGGETDQGPDVGEFHHLNLSQLDKAIAQFDTLHQRIFFALPAMGKSRNTLIHPYNVKLNVWEDTWDPMDISAMGILYESATGFPYVAIGNYRGRAFKLWGTPYVDGVRVSSGTGTFTLKGTPTAVGAASLTDTTATFDTADDGLDEIPVIAVSPTGTVSRNIIESNSTTVLTLAENWAPLPDTTWKYYIGSPNFEFDTQEMAPTAATLLRSSGSKFNTRNFKHVMLKGMSDTGDAHIEILAFVDTVLTQISTDITGTGMTWDVDNWDEGIWGTAAAVATHHVGLGRRGKVCGLRIVNRDPAVGFVLLGIGLKGTEHGYKD